jgi:hypothetical protein
MIIMIGSYQNRSWSQQSNGTGSLSIHVTDVEYSLPILGYAASLTPRNGNSPLLSTPNNNGIASFKKIPAGSYRLKVSRVGYFPEVYDSLVVLKDSIVTMDVHMNLYNGVTEYDAYDDLAKGIVRIYRSEWFLGPGTEVSLKYGFRVQLKCCDPTFQFDRYNAVVNNYLDSLNGPGWYDLYLRDLWLAKVRDDSLNNRPRK